MIPISLYMIPMITIHDPMIIIYMIPMIIIYMIPMITIHDPMITIHDPYDHYT